MVRRMVEFCFATLNHSPLVADVHERVDIVRQVEAIAEAGFASVELDVFSLRAWRENGGGRSAGRGDARAWRRGAWRVHAPARRAVSLAVRRPGRLADALEPGSTGLPCSWLEPEGRPAIG